MVVSIMLLQGASISEMASTNGLLSYNHACCKTNIYGLTLTSTHSYICLR
jgi:hypothetical protein